MSNTADINKILKIVIGILVALVLVFAILIIKAIIAPNQTPRSALESQIIQIEDELKKNPKDATAYNDLGTLYARAGKNDRALEYYTRAIKLDPKIDKPYFNIAIIYIKEGKTNEATVQINKALKINPKSAEAYNQLGLISYSNKDYKKALEYFQKAVKNAGTITDYHYYLGQTYEKLGKPKDAISEYKQVLKYIPDDVNAKKALEKLEKK